MMSRERAVSNLIKKNHIGPLRFCLEGTEHLCIFEKYRPTSPDFKNCAMPSVIKKQEILYAATTVALHSKFPQLLFTTTLNCSLQLIFSKNILRRIKPSHSHFFPRKMAKSHVHHSNRILGFRDVHRI